MIKHLEERTLLWKNKYDFCKVSHHPFSMCKKRIQFPIYTWTSSWQLWNKRLDPVHGLVMTVEEKPGGNGQLLQWRGKEVVGFPGIYIRNNAPPIFSSLQYCLTRALLFVPLLQRHS